MLPRSNSNVKQRTNTSRKSSAVSTISLPNSQPSRFSNASGGIGSNGSNGSRTNQREVLPGDDEPQQDVIIGADGKPVINLPIPQFLKPLFHTVIGQYLYVEDEFVQTVRTFGALVFFVAAFATAIATVFQLTMYWTQGEALPDLIEGVCLVLASISYLSIYIRLRVLKQVTDGMVLAMVGTTTAAWTVAHICTTSYPLVWLNYSMIMCSMVLRVPYLGFFWTYYVLLTCHAMVTHAYLHTPGAFLLLFPGTRVTQGLEPIVVNVLAGIPPCIVAAAVWFSFEEQKRQVRVANASTELAHKVVAHLRRYNTDRVQEIVDEARTSGEANVDLISSFEALVGNLERYRPFLPNYLFLGTSSSEEDDDDEGTVCVTETPTSTVRSHSRHSRQSDTPSQCLRMSQGEPVVTERSSLNDQPTTFNQEIVHTRGVVACAHVEVNTNAWFSLRLSNKSDRAQKHILGTFTDTIFEMAKGSKASIHSMIGDRVQLSWNATHRVAQPEAKAATFLLKLRDAVAAVLPHLQLAGACCAGIAEMHSAFSAATKQQALYIDAPWLPALEGCYHLATKYKTLIVDSNTAAGGEYDVVAQPVDCIKYRPRIAFLPDGSPAMSLGSGAKNMPDVGPEFNDAPFDGSYVSFASGQWGKRTSPTTAATRLCSSSPEGNSVEAATSLHCCCERKTLAFELLKLQEARAEDEWMYQLMEDERSGREKESDPCTVTLYLALQGQFGAALQFLEKRTAENSIADNRRSSDAGTATSPMLEQLANLCHERLA